MAAVVVFVALTVPPGQIPLAAPPAFAPAVSGLLHVHTNRSDGLSGPDEVAAEAARAGLKFLVFTDHGDATRTPDPPTYRAGVLCLDGVEISTKGGHLVALDMPAAPYPLGGEARDVVDDVKRLGGFSIAAHPDSPKVDLKWREWTAPIDGMELLNLDTSWRVVAAERGWRSKWRLFEALVDYPFRAPEVIASLIQPTTALYNWEALTRRRRVVVSAGADAHAKLGEGRRVVSIPGYESSFRVMSIRASLDRALTGDAAADAAAIVRAIRGGHFYTAVDAVASEPAFEFTATNSHGTVSEGDELAADDAVQLHVRSNAPASFTTIVHEGVRTIAENRAAADLTVHAAAGPGVYWVEIVATGQRWPITWLRSNPIYVRAAQPGPGLPVRPPAVASTPIFDGKQTGRSGAPPTTGWSVEHDPTSLVALDAPRRPGGGTELLLRYGLSGGDLAGQVVGLVFDTPSGVAPNDRLTFTVRAEHPMRISVQLRAAPALGEGVGERGRWQRSIYVDGTDREHTVFFSDLVPVGGTELYKAPLADIRSLLFVIDTTNTKPGASGRVWIRSAALQK